MDREPIVGIDLGTTNSEVAFIFDGQPRVIKENDDGIVPSCVGLDPDGKVMVGTPARNQYIVSPERTVVSIKRKMGSVERVPMGEEYYSPQEISAFILKALKERAERALGRPVRKAVVTVPAYFTDVQRQATREAGEIAGLEVVRIINEPTAAALAYGSHSTDPQKILVYDLGGGTFDVSVVSIEAGVVEVLASIGDNHLGGDDFDQMVQEHLIEYLEGTLGLSSVREDRALQARLRRAAERAKIELSDAPYARVEEDHVGEVGGQSRHLSLELSRLDFEQDIEEALSQTMRAVTTALNDAAVRPSELEKILLVGGSTRIPRIGELLWERLGQEPHDEVDPDLCVALGAAVQAGMEMGIDVQSVLVDITPYTFGTSAIGQLYGRPYAHQFVPLIRRNAKLPATRTEVFFTMYEDQESVQVQVFQGEDPDALKNVKIGNFVFQGLNQKAGANQQGILLTYSLDLDGLLQIHAVERATGQEIRGVIENATGRSTPEELDAYRERVAGLWGDEAVEGEVPWSEAEVGDDLPDEMRETLERAGVALDRAAAEDREEIINLMEDIRDALREGRLDNARESKQELDEILFYLG
ncbi:MAG TPA: Hsp70 family protein [Dehalococcoidia bacterium]|nr:Hsp70 family protein [Dehalococcoidia bacterium]